MLNRKSRIIGWTDEYSLNDKVKSRLETLGFVVGESISIVNRVNDNIIIEIKGVSIALRHELTKRIYV